MQNLNHKKDRPNIVVIGGGTGSFVVLSGLRKYPLNLTALITMMDSGGSTGRLRDQLGVLPPGDLRQALIALSASESQQIWRDLFAHRFSNGDLKGHNFGNIFISALEKLTGSIEDAIALGSKLLNTTGDVIPITLDRCNLCVRLEDGAVIKGEAFIDIEEPERPRIVKSFLDSPASANPKALEAIAAADFIILAPGDIYTSLVPNLLVQGVAEAINTSAAKKVYIVNLMTKVGQTDGLSASDHYKTVKKYINGSSSPHILMNSGVYPLKALKTYALSNTYPVYDDLGDGSHLGVEVVRRDLLSDVIFEKTRSDEVKRSLIRHDSHKLADAIIEIFNM